jgi:Holliday junction resolvase RusA-like endonuclease
MARIARAVREAMPDVLAGPVVLSVDFIWRAQSKRAPVARPSRPDIDNCVKLVSDALNGVAWVDDAQVVEVHARKFYGPDPCTRIRVMEWTDGANAV